MTVATGAMTAAMTAAMTGVTGAMTAATAVPAPDCYGDSSTPGRAQVNGTRSTKRVDPLDDRVDSSHEGRTRSDQAHENRGVGREAVSPPHPGGLAVCNRTRHKCWPTSPPTRCEPQPISLTANGNGPSNPSIADRVLEPDAGRRYDRDAAASESVEAPVTVPSTREIFADCIRCASAISAEACRDVSAGPTRPKVRKRLAEAAERVESPPLDDVLRSA